MKQVHIKPTWSIQDPGGPPMPARLVGLLSVVQSSGSLMAGARALGMSYRHAWDLVRQSEAQFRAPLLHMARGKGSRLAPLGETLVWAEQRIAARLKPVLDSMASELAAEIRQVVHDQPAALRVRASHGYAIEALLAQLALEGPRLQHQYVPALAAVAALRDGACDLAGLHIPVGPLEDATLTHYWRWLAGEDLVVIDVALRRQGLMVALGNPRGIYDVADVARADVRFINRQAGSGTRLLLEGLLREQGVPAGAITGFEGGELTHEAVAACVASGMADAAFGLEAAARRFQLDFVPLALDRYFLLCRRLDVGKPAVQAVVAALGTAALRGKLQALPGYDATQAGRVMPLQDAFPALKEWVA